MSVQLQPEKPAPTFWRNAPMRVAIAFVAIAYTTMLYYAWH